MKFAVWGCLSVVAVSAGCGNAEGVGGGSTAFGASSTSSGTGFGGTTTTGTGPGGGPFGGAYNEPVVTTRPAPPAISGGTLLVIGQGHKAAVADPERDSIVIVDLDLMSVSTTVALQKGDEPGRLVEDQAGLVHVTLRGSGAVATIDPRNGTVRSRQNVCANPRGLAYDASTDAIHVACAGGELVSLTSTGGLVRQLELDRDLRDVVIDDNRLLVSRFRAAELLVVESDGHVSGRLSPASVVPIPGNNSGPPGDPGAVGFSPGVAWRTIAAPGGGALMAFQEEQTTEVQIQAGGYGGFCGGIVRGGVALLRVDGTGWTVPNVAAVLPVDLTVANNGRITVAAAGGTNSPIGGARPLVGVLPPTGPVNPGECPIQMPGEGEPTLPGGQVVAVATDALGRLLVQTREPMLIVGDRAIVLPGSIVRDTGHDLFHMGTSGSIACASCHPEGRDDGHVWRFAGLGQRRTQSLGGGTLGPGPFHWTGDMRDFTMLAHEVFNTRMSGPPLLAQHVVALSSWLDQVPPLRPSPAADQSAVDRGRALFNDANVACATCHGGNQLTNRNIVDVGTGAKFKVPSLLGVGFRAPFMHDGCAARLEDRFGTACGGGDRHGRVDQLGAAERADLVAYLGTL